MQSRVNSYYSYIIRRCADGTMDMTTYVHMHSLGIYIYQQVGVELGDITQGYTRRSRSQVANTGAAGRMCGKKQAYRYLQQEQSKLQDHLGPNSHHQPGEGRASIFFFFFFCRGYIAARCAEESFSSFNLPFLLAPCFFFFFCYGSKLLTLLTYITYLRTYVSWFELGSYTLCGDMCPTNLDIYTVYISICTYGYCLQLCNNSTRTTVVTSTYELGPPLPPFFITFTRPDHPSVRPSPGRQQSAS